MDIDKRTRRKAIIFLAIAGTILWFPLVYALIGRTPVFLRDLGFLSGPGGTPLAWLLAGIVAIAYSAYVLRNPLVRQYAFSLSALKASAVLIAVAAAIVEEALFRRWLMDWVMEAGGGAFVQIAASALIFGVAHGIWGIVTGKLAVAVAVTIATGILGAALGVVYIVGDRSLAPPIVSHFIITATMQPGIMFAMFSRKTREPRD